eukprot:CAMPEP_0184378188 /NCGR_PEP_ID=MMETSP0007-20130409/2856_1 /TAXON_ID=97485 /ORGANISM="Prymnesium parvum, Strain Texoma1" /LENGTH=47 /DNA_ID= /DNA_START= /DNA_END= /DNA_ORIENTATION=
MTEDTANMDVADKRVYIWWIKEHHRPRAAIGALLLEAQRGGIDPLLR